MNHTYIESLIHKAKGYWAKGEPCPVDIIATLCANGIDAHALEESFDANQTEEDDING